MIYLDGNIGAIYLNKYWHERAYLGSVLVWNSNPDWRRSGKASAKIAFITTTQGVSAILLPATTESDVSIDSEINAFPRGAYGSIVDDNVSLKSNIINDEAIVEDSIIEYKTSFESDTEGSFAEIKPGILDDSVIIQHKIGSIDAIIEPNKIQDSLAIDHQSTGDDVYGNSSDSHQLLQITHKSAGEDIKGISSEVFQGINIENSLSAQDVVIERTEAKQQIGLIDDTTLSEISAESLVATSEVIIQDEAKGQDTLSVPSDSKQTLSIFPSNLTGSKQEAKDCIPDSDIQIVSSSIQPLSITMLRGTSDQALNLKQITEGQGVIIERTSPDSQTIILSDKSTAQSASIRNIKGKQQVSINHNIRSDDIHCNESSSDEGLKISSSLISDSAAVLPTGSLDILSIIPSLSMNDIDIQENNVTSKIALTGENIGNLSSGLDCNIQGHITTDNNIIITPVSALDCTVLDSLLLLSNIQPERVLVPVNSITKENINILSSVSASSEFVWDDPSQEGDTLIITDLVNCQQLGCILQIDYTAGPVEELSTVTSYVSGTLSNLDLSTNTKITELKDYTFADYAFTSLKLPQTLQSIGEYVLYGYSPNIPDITIPSTVTSIGYQFCGRNKNFNINIYADLKVIPPKFVTSSTGTVYFYGSTSVPEQLFWEGDSSPYSLDKISAIKVPISLLEEWKTDVQWKYDADKISAI